VNYGDTTINFVAIPYKEESLSRGFGEAHKRYTRMKNFKDNVRGYLSQGRFGSCILDERHLLAAVSYLDNIDKVRRPFYYDM